MLSYRLYNAMLAGFLAVGFAGGQGRSGMSPNTQGALVLTAKPRGATAKPLVPEQAAEFDVLLRNQSNAPLTVNSLDNRFTPVIHLFDSQGRPLGHYTSADRRDRIIGDLGPKTAESTRTITLAPGDEKTTWVNVWSHTDPFPPGAYWFEASHQAQDAESLVSSRLPFQIVAARVDDSALGYDKNIRANTVLAWLATPAGGSAARLLIRLSGFTSHAVVQLGATLHGEFPSNSRVAVSATPPDGPLPAVGWVAVVSGDRLQLIQHNMSTPMWRAPAVTLPATGAIPVPRFPNRRHAVFLATGAGPKGPVLIGVKAANGNTALLPWSVGLSHIPVHSASAFMMEGAITLLLAADDGRTSRLIRLDVSEDGTVTAPERVVHESPNEVLAVVTDSRGGEPLSFVVLESDRTNHNQLAFIKIPLSGQLKATELRTIDGWPTVEVKGELRPARAQSLLLETDNQGMPWVTLTNERGDLLGGRMDGALSLLREGRIAHAVFPHIGAVARGVTISCFNPDGTLFHSGGADGH